MALWHHFTRRQLRMCISKLQVLRERDSTKAHLLQSAFLAKTKRSSAVDGFSVVYSCRFLFERRFNDIFRQICAWGNYKLAAFFSNVINGELVRLSAAKSHLFFMQRFIHSYSCSIWTVQRDDCHTADGRLMHYSIDWMEFGVRCDVVMLSCHCISVRCI